MTFYYQFQMLFFIFVCTLVEASSNYHMVSAASTFPPKSALLVNDPNGKTTKYIYFQHQDSPFYDQQQSNRYRSNTRPFIIEASHMQVPHAALHQQTPALKSPRLLFLSGNQVIPVTFARESYNPQRVLYPESNLAQGSKLRAENTKSTQSSEKDDDLAKYQKIHQRKTSEIEKQLPSSQYGLVSPELEGSFEQGTTPGAPTETVQTQPRSTVDDLDQPDGDSAVTVVMDSTVPFDDSQPYTNTRYEGTIEDKIKDDVSDDIEGALEDLGIGEEYLELHDKLLRDVQLIQDFVNTV